MTGPPPLDHVWWLASRSSGLLALALVTFSTIVGLSMSGKMMRREPGEGSPRVLTPRTLMKTHELTSLAAMIAIGVHGVTLLGDAYLHPTLSQLAVPFTIGYRTTYTGLGIIGGYLTVILGLSFYLRQRIGTNRWKAIHRFTLGAYVLSVVHTLGAGSDAGSLWLQTAVFGSAALVTMLLFARIATARATGRAAQPVRARNVVTVGSSNENAFEAA